MNKHFKDIVTHGALGNKIKVLRDFVGTPSDPVLNSNEHPEGQFKNVCAPIHIGWDNKLERIVSILGMSKREFIREAIQSAITEADLIIKEINASEGESRYVHGTVRGIEEKNGEKFLKFDVIHPPEFIELTDELAEEFLKAGIKSGDIVEQRDGKYVKVEEEVQ